MEWKLIFRQPWETLEVDSVMMRADDAVLDGWVPSLEHASLSEWQRVYEPADDTFLLLDALYAERAPEKISRPRFSWSGARLAIRTSFPELEKPVERTTRQVKNRIIGKRYRRRRARERERERERARERERKREREMVINFRSLRPRRMKGSRARLPCLARGDHPPTTT